MTNLRCFACLGMFLQALVFFPAVAPAGAPTTVSTTLTVQVEGQPSKNEVAVSADENKKPTGQVMLYPQLWSMPPGATLKSCALRLVTASGVRETFDNGIRLQLFDDTEKTKPVQIGIRRVDGGTPGAGKDPRIPDDKSEVVFRSEELCESLQKSVNAGGNLWEKVADAVRRFELSRDPNWHINVHEAHKKLMDSVRPITLRLQTNTRGSKIDLFGNRPPEDAWSRAPRLMVTYELPDSKPSVAGWSQPRADAQHSGRSPWRMYNPQGKYTPGGFTTRSLGTQAYLDVSPRALLYRRMVLAVVSDGSAVKMMNSDGSPVKNIVLPVKPKFITVSQHGWLYATGENKIVVQDVDHNNRFDIKIDDKETVLVPPTVGTDGGFYVVTNRYVYAYPAPPVTTSSDFVPLWRYGTGGSGNDDVSAVALGDDGRTVYIVDKQTATMIALDVATGAEKWKRTGLTISRGSNDPMPVPVVTGNTIFVTDRASNAGKLYVVEDKEVPSLRTLAGRGISAPVVGPDGSAYYLLEGQLRRYVNGKDDTSFKPACTQLAGFDLLRTDESGNLYAVNTGDKRFAFIPSIDLSVPTGKCAPVDLNTLGVSLAVAADGTAYTYNENRQLEAIVPTAGSFGGGDTLSLGNDIITLNPKKTAVVTNNDMTFRAGKTVETADLTLPANANINLVAGERITFGPGLRVAEGARLRARAGF